MQRLSWPGVRPGYNYVSELGSASFILSQVFQGDLQLCACISDPEKLGGNNCVLF